MILRYEINSVTKIIEYLRGSTLLADATEKPIKGGDVTANTHKISANFISFYMLLK